MREGSAQAAVRTFLIADIRGYTTFTRQRGDEAASRLATKFARVTSEGVVAWGGELVELRGDEAMAVFGSPRAALRAAIELQSAFADETSAESDLPLSVGIGLDAGEAVPVGDGYRGAALNLAARLSAAAAGGQVLASPQLAHLVGTVEGLRYELLDSLTLKGFDEPIEPVSVADADGTHEHVTRPPHTPGTLPPDLDPVVPLCGRLTELGWLSWHMRRADHGHGRAAALSGPPGIGKTRLAAEIATRAHARGMRVEYIAAARPPPADELTRLLGADCPTVVVVDDLDAAPATFSERVASSAAEMAERPLLLLITHRQEAPPALAELVARTAGRERVLRLGPLDADAVREIAALYAGRAVGDLSIDHLVSESGGVPAAVHRVASRAASTVASRRLGTAANRTRAGRQDLRAAEAELIDDVAELELLRERAKLFVSPEDEEEPDGLAICPYKGLEPFEAADADYYFGRERLVAELVARLVGTSFLGLVGASGSGKSSALRAGLLPALAGGVLPGSDGWPRLLLRPGEHPLHELRMALARTARDPERVPEEASAALQAALDQLPAGGRQVLVVDQFEEVFTTARDEAERDRFVELITSTRAGLKVLVSLRADHYGHCAAYPALARALAGNHVLVGPLNSIELAATIERPAQKVGLRVEPELVSALVSDVGDEPGALPLLSTALLELWQARDGRRMTLAAYNATGGVRGAVARLAESAYQRLGEDEREVARSIFLRLAGPGEGEGVVRRRVPLAELDVERDPRAAAVVGVLTDARLLTTGEGYVEVAHEALLREWPRAQAWLAEDAVGRELRLHLSDAARDWEARGREPGELYRGARLAAALDWAASHAAELNASEREFLAASQAEAEREIRRQRRTNRRLRTLLAGAAVFLVLAIAAGTFAVTQLQRAEDAGALARSHELAAYAIAVLDDDPALSKVLALSAATSISDPPIETISALHQAWAADRVIARYDWPGDTAGIQLSADLDPSGRYVAATISGGSRVEVRDPFSGELRWEFDPGAGNTTDPIFSPDGRLVAAGIIAEDEPASGAAAGVMGAYVWDAVTGAQLHHFARGPCGTAVDALTDSHVVIARSTAEGGFCWDDDGAISLEVLELATGDSSTFAQGTFGAVVSLTGNRLAFEDLSGTTPASKVVDLASGEVLLTLDAADTTAQMDRYVRALSSDGELLLYGDRPLHVYEVDTGDRLGVYGRHAGEAFAAEFASEGAIVYSLGRDASLHRWNAEDGEQLDVFPGVGAGLVAPGPAGVVLVLDSDGGAGWLLDTAPKGEVGQVATCDSALFYGGSLSIAAGVTAHAQECDGEAITYLVDPLEGKVLRAIPKHDGQGLALSPDGSRIVRQSRDETTTYPPAVIDVASGTELTLQGVCAWNGAISTPPHEQAGCREFPATPFPLWNWQLDWSPDGSMVAAVDRASQHGQLVVWDAQTGALVFTGPTDAFGSDAIFSPDSAVLLFGHDLAGQARVTAYSTSSWEPLAEGNVPGGLTFVGYTADGGTVIGATGYGGVGGGALHWLDAETLAVTGQSIARIHDGSPKSHAMSPDRSLVATGASDGFVRVWSAEHRTLLHEFRIGDEQVQGLAFVNDRHLAVGPQSGHLYIYTIDRDELIGIVRASVLRGYSELECDRFNFGDDCPTLGELRGQ